MTISAGNIPTIRKTGPGMPGSTISITEGEVGGAKPGDTDVYDLCLTSPPYEDARAYGSGFRLRGDDWVAWAADRFADDVYRSRNAVAWVVDGRTRDRRWSGTPFLLWTELQSRGFSLRKPIIYHRSGIPGKTDYLRNDYEFVIVASARDDGRFAYCSPESIGAPPRNPNTGRMSNRRRDGRRVRGNSAVPRIANPGNVFSGLVGGGHMGSRIAEAHDAPYPLWLAARLIRLFVGPGGRVLDRFAGSGTTLAAAGYLGRSADGFDIDPWAFDLSCDRIEEVREDVRAFLAGDHGAVRRDPITLIRAGVTDRTRIGLPG